MRQVGLHSLTSVRVRQQFGICRGCPVDGRDISRGADRFRAECRNYCPRAVRHALQRDCLQPGHVTRHFSMKDGSPLNLVPPDEGPSAVFFSALIPFNEFGFWATCLWTRCERDRGSRARMPASESQRMDHISAYRRGPRPPGPILVGGSFTFTMKIGIGKRWLHRVPPERARGDSYGPG